MPITVDGRSASGTAPAPAATLVIFGAGGDLTRRLLVPSLYNLAGSGLLDPGFAVIGVDHSMSSTERWRRDLGAAMQSFTRDPAAEFHAERIDARAWRWVEQRLDYLQGDFESPALYEGLERRLKGSVLFYLATGERFFAGIVERLAAAGLLQEQEGAFRRVVIEKPFGHDLASSRALNRQLLAAGRDGQFFRIDHFLGKDTVQSILALRFANRLYESVWSRRHIDHVQITAAETVGVEARGRFYEGTGALRDMVPNHLFQLFCMTAMEPPATFDAASVRKEKENLLKALRPVQPEKAVRGQYGAGMGKPAYRQEKGVAATSRTETFAALELEIDNPRWAGVPFFLRTGKRLAARHTEITVCFKLPEAKLFRGAAGQALQPDRLRLLLDPVRGVRTDFAVKRPGPGMRPGTVATGFDYDDFFHEPANVGYETLIYDALVGDAALFQSAGGIEAGWAAVEPLLQAWSDGEPEIYPAGSAGPAGADRLIRQTGRNWLELAA
ncbi:glucose-6-phosphate dehydrogenase [Radicibacter daui]|uniref:glucose-6-phosphate dehydrogenase n=1 Tax=Radicibacter daui TaxID=3064829 RepID=UPI004046F024